MTSTTSPLSRRDFALCMSGAALLLASIGMDSLLSRELNDPAAIAAAVPLLQRIPQTIGAWTSVEGQVDEREQRLGGIAGALRRDYRNSENGQTVTLTVLCGAAGPMSVHPPTACFEGVGYTLVSGPSIVGISDATDSTVSLNRAVFRPQDAPVAEVVRVFWGWSTDGNWDAPENPRVAFHGQPVLFKLYAVDRAFETADDLSQSEAFLKDALPEIRAALIQQGKSASAVSSSAVSSSPASGTAASATAASATTMPTASIESSVQRYYSGATFD